MRIARAVERALRAPGLHFAALGALLFALAGTRAGDPAAGLRAREPIVVSAAQIEQILERYARGTGLAPTEDDARALVEQEIEGEVLYREAIARGLDRNDRGVQWRLIEKMSFLSDGDDVPRDDLLAQAVGLGLEREDRVIHRILVEQMRLTLKHGASVGKPDEAALEAYLAQHRDRFVQPARVRLSHVVVARDRHAGSLAADAARLRDELSAAGVGPEAAAAHGDAFPMDRVGWLATEGELVARFGEEFARAVRETAPGAWSAPIPSPFGLHLVWVQERIAERLPPLAEVRGRVLYGLLAELREAAFVARLRELRDAYEVHVEWPARLASASPGTRP